MVNEVITKQFYELISPEKIELIKKLDELQKRSKVIMDALRKDGVAFLEDNNYTEEGYEQDGIKLSYKKGYTKKVVDTDAMKEQGIYEDFTKEIYVNPTVTISVVYEE